MSTPCCLASKLIMCARARLRCRATDRPTVVRARLSSKRISNILRTTFRRASSSRARRACQIKAVGARAAGLAGGIQTHASFADPNDQSAGPRRERDGRVTMRVPGSSMRQTRPPIGICVRTPFASTTTNAPSSTSSLSILDENDRRAILQRDRPRRSQPRQAGLMWPA